MSRETAGAAQAVRNHGIKRAAKRRTVQRVLPSKIRLIKKTLLHLLITARPSGTAIKKGP
jgi:hypothetical protein